MLVAMTNDVIDLYGLDALPERERTVIVLRFFESLTQSQIAERVGISQMHVSRLLRRALPLLRWGRAQL